MESGMTIRRLAAATALTLGSISVSAQDLTEGTEINAGNWEQMKAQTYEGKTIESMVPDSIQKAVREYGLKITLRHSEPLTYANHIMEATAKHSSQVKYDPTTRMVDGWVAGIPLPDIKTVIEAAPPEQGGDMVLYNAALAAVNVADNSNCYGPYATVQIDPEKGVERVQGASASYFRVKGRTTGGPTFVGKNPNELEDPGRRLRQPV